MFLRGMKNRVGGTKPFLFVPGSDWKPRQSKLLLRFMAQNSGSFVLGAPDFGHSLKANRHERRGRCRVFKERVPVYGESNLAKRRSDFHNFFWPPVEGAVILEMQFFYGDGITARYLVVWHSRCVAIELMKLSRLILVLMCFAGAVPRFDCAARADLWWDTNGATAGSSGGSSAPGSFNGTNWTTNPAGTSATQSWVPGETAVFSAGTNAYNTNGYQVTVSTPSIEVAGIKVEEGFPSLSNTTKTLAFTNGALAVDVASGRALWVSMLYGPTNGVITKTGPGEFYTHQDQTSFAGKWVVNEGVLTFSSLVQDRAIGVTPAAVVSDQITLNNGGRILGYGTDKRGITLGPGGGGFGSDGAGLISASWAGPITGSSGGALIVDIGYSAWISNTNNNYDGDTVIKKGVLICGASSVIPDTSTIRILNNSQFSVNGYNEAVKTITGTSGSIILDGEGGHFGSLTFLNPAGEVLGSQISGSAKVIKNGAGALTLTGANTFSEFVLNSGTIGVGSNSALGNKITINGGTLANNSTSTRSIATNVPASINSDFTVDDSLNAAPGRIELKGLTTMNASHTITISGAASLLLTDVKQAVANVGLTKAGAGTLDLRGGGTAPNVFSGPITVQAGRLQVDGISRLGNGFNTINLAGGALSFTGYRDYWNNQVSNPITVTADSEIIARDGGSLVLNTNSFTGTGKITFRNETPSALGTFFPSLWGTGASFAPGPIEIANGPLAATVLGVGHGTTTRTTFNSVISGTGSLEVRGVPYGGPINGATVLNAANTYSGDTLVTYGVLLVNNPSGSGTGSGPVSVGVSGMLAGTGTISGAVTNSGRIAPGGSIGTLTTGSDVTMAADSRLAIELSGATADKLVVGGNLDLASNDFLDVTGSGAGPWVIATYSGLRSGTFDNVTSGYLVDYTTPGAIVLNTIALPGDYNGDGVVDGADYRCGRSRRTLTAGPRGTTRGGRIMDGRSQAGGVRLICRRCQSRRGWC